MVFRKHRDTAAVLLVACYIAAMLFFAIVRAFGLLWFQQEYVHTGMPEWAAHALMYAFWVIDGVIALRVLTGVKLWKILLLIVAIRIPFVFWYANNISDYIEVSMVLIFPMFVNKDKERSLGYSLVFMLLVLFYQLTMMFGRGYPFLARFSISWQILLTIDYRMFIFGLLILKGAIGLFEHQNEIARNELFPVPGDGRPSGPGCWFFIGKFDVFCKKLGYWTFRVITLGIYGRS